MIFVLRASFMGTCTYSKECGRYSSTADWLEVIDAAAGALDRKLIKIFKHLFEEIEPLI